MIIPQVSRNVSADEREAAGKEPDYIAIPSTCPVCGGVAKLVRENDTTVLMCTNENCSGKLLGKLTHFVSKKGMNIDGLSERTLELLISTNLIKDFIDIYKLSDHRGKLVTLDGMGKKSVENILNNEKEILLILDNAKIHHAEDVKIASKILNIELMYLPEYSPDLQPIEDLWKIIKSVAYLKDYENLDELIWIVTEEFYNHVSSSSLYGGWIDEFMRN
jgi:hypothetical protein